jgi:hypothetical protein
MLATCLRLVYCLAYFSALKVEAKCSSEMSVDFQRTTQHYIPEDRTLKYTVCMQAQVTPKLTSVLCLSLQFNKRVLVYSHMHAFTVNYDQEVGM